MLLLHSLHSSNTVLFFIVLTLCSPSQPLVLKNWIRMTEPGKTPHSLFISCRSTSLLLLTSSIGTSTPLAFRNMIGSIIVVLQFNLRRLRLVSMDPAVELFKSPSGRQGPWSALSLPIDSATLAITISRRKVMPANLEMTCTKKGHCCS